MQHLRLKHHRKLGLPANRQTSDIPAQGLGADVTLVSFRDCGLPARPLVVDATTRADIFGQTRSVFLDHLEDDSPIAAPLVNDVLHSLPVGATVHLRTGVATPLVEQEYYAGAFRKTGVADGVTSYLKTQACLTEADRGLKQWSFCIPCGPGDATLLNKVVSRILSFKDLEAEILLSGTPGENFQFSGQVRLVPDRREGSTAASGAINICEKKNLLVEHAIHPNLCILHDRVFLPANFGAIMREYGEIYAMHTLQSLYFDDYHNMAGVRYSDANVIEGREGRVSPIGLMKDRIKLSQYSTSTVHQHIGSSGFAYQHPMRHSANSYATGSMYICKRSLWGMYPQNEGIQWGELEDVEHGQRLQNAGVPLRINPHGVSQSFHCRPMLLFAAKINISQSNGRIKSAKLPLPIGPSRRKPFFRVSQEAALAGLKALAGRYGFDQYHPPKGAAETTTTDWLTEVFAVGNRISVQRRFEDVRAFVLDWTRTTTFDASNYHANELFTTEVLDHGTNGLRNFVVGQPAYVTLIALRPHASVFCSNPAQYLVKTGVKLKLGSAASALRFWVTRYRHLYLRGGPAAYYKAILASTPIKERP